MTDAPERIWADGNQDWDSGSWGQDKEYANDVEYVRADRIAELEANINIKADFIEATINQLAESDQRIAELEETLALRTNLHGEAAYLIHKLEAKLRKCVGALGDISDGEPEWPNDPQKELDWCRNRAKKTIAELKGQDDE